MSSCVALTELKARPYLHGIEGQVAWDLKLLHEHLLLDVVDADKLRLASCQDGLPVCWVTQRRKGPGCTESRKNNLNYKFHKKPSNQTFWFGTEKISSVLSLTFPLPTAWLWLYLSLCGPSPGRGVRPRSRFVWLFVGSRKRSHHSEWPQPTPDHQGGTSLTNLRKTNTNTESVVTKSRVTQHYPLQKTLHFKDI